MKKANSWLVLGVTAALAMTVMAGCEKVDQSGSATGNGGTSKPTLTMLTSADYPPYEYHDTSSGSDQIIGFDIDVAKRIGEKVGFNVQVQDTDFNGLLPALEAKRADFVMAGMTPKPERLKNADFSDIYYEAKNTIVSNKGTNYTDLTQLKGKKVGVQLGSIQEGEAKKDKDINVISLNKIGDIVQELKAGRIDAAIIEDVVAKGYTKANQDLVFNTIKTDGPSGSAVAFPKGSDKVAAFNKALKEMKDSGEIDALVKKWFEKK